MSKRHGRTLTPLSCMSSSINKNIWHEPKRIGIWWCVMHADNLRGERRWGKSEKNQKAWKIIKMITACGKWFRHARGGWCKSQTCKIKLFAGREIGRNPVTNWKIDEQHVKSRVMVESDRKWRAIDLHAYGVLVEYMACKMRECASANTYNLSWTWLQETRKRITRKHESTADGTIK